MKYIVVTGGILSGLGKGITASSIGLLLKECGYRVTAVKIDPYLNCDAGTMSPFQHGEVFVLDDGGEADLDLGNYERFLDVNLKSDHNITTGKVYRSVIERERRGDFLGKTVQIVPHITDEIKGRIREVAERGGDYDICVVEVGGTIGDIESMPFVEAIRQLFHDVGEENTCLVHTTLVPVVGPVGEQKTKPTQHSVKVLMGLGLSPDIIVCRSSKPVEEAARRKIASFCMVRPEHVFSAHDVADIYKVPLLLDEQNIVGHVSQQLGLVVPSNYINRWQEIARTFTETTGQITIALVGKYTGLSDSYLSVIRSLDHAGASIGVKVDVEWVESSSLEASGDAKSWAVLEQADGILIPGGFGIRGIEGKIAAVTYSREQKIPYLGICLGMQVAVIEFSRSQLGLDKANSTEFDEGTPHPVVEFMPEQRGADKGGTMRLGLRTTIINPESKAFNIYGEHEVQERHRHRYEVNKGYIERIEKAGLRFSGKSTDGERMEIAELLDHPYFIGTQFHPEFLSRPGRPAPVFREFVTAAAIKAGAATVSRQSESIRNSI